MKRARPETLVEYLIEYALTRELERETLRQYEIAVQLYDRWRAGHGMDVARLNCLDELELSAWLRDYAASGRAPSTVRSKRVMLVTLWRQAADDGYCEPPRRRIRSVRVWLDAPTCWTDQEVYRLLEACQELPRWHRCGLRRSIWWELAVRVAWDTGLRWGDLIRLCVDQIPPTGFFAMAQHKTKRIAVCRLDAPTMELLQESLEACPRELVVPWLSSRETFNDQVRTLVRRAGIRAGTWKWLRRASGTDVEIQQPGAATRQLGHKAGSTVAYTNYVDPRLVAAAGQFVYPRTLPRIRRA